MTGLTLYVVSALVSALIVGLVWLLGFRAVARIKDEGHVRALLADQEPGFVPSGDVVLDKAGRAALVEGADGSFCVVRAVGDGLAVRRFPAIAKHLVQKDAATVTVASPDFGYPTLVIQKH